MKTLIYSNTGLTSKQIGLTGEVIKRLQESGHEVKIVMCDNVLDNCYFNRTHNVLACVSCQSSFALDSLKTSLALNTLKPCGPD